MNTNGSGGGSSSATTRPSYPPTNNSSNSHTSGQGNVRQGGVRLSDLDPASTGSYLSTGGLLVESQSSSEPLSNPHLNSHQHAQITGTTVPLTQAAVAAAAGHSLSQFTFPAIVERQFLGDMLRAQQMQLRPPVAAPPGLALPYLPNDQLLYQLNQQRLRDEAMLQSAIAVEDVQSLSSQVSASSRDTKTKIGDIEAQELHSDDRENDQEVCRINTPTTRSTSNEHEQFLAQRRRHASAPDELIMNAMSSKQLGEEEVVFAIFQ